MRHEKNINFLRNKAYTYRDAFMVNLLGEDFYRSNPLNIIDGNNEPPMTEEQAAVILASSEYQIAEGLFTALTEAPVECQCFDFIDDFVLEDEEILI